MTPPVDSVRPETTAEAVAPRPLPAPVEHFAALQRHAQALAGAASLPRHLRGSPADVLLVLRAAEDLGLTFTAAMQGLHIVEGKLAMGAELMRALAWRTPGVKFDYERGDDQAATARIEREGRVYKATFTIEDARRAGLLHKDNWKKYPAMMLQARATSAVCRQAIPDVLGGVGHTPEELDADEYGPIEVDSEPVEVAVETPSAPEPAPQPLRATSEQYETIEVLLARLPEDRAHEVVERMKAALHIDSLEDLTRDMADQAIPRLRANVEAERARTPEEPAHRRLATILGQATPDVVRQAWRNRIDGNAEPSSPATQARFKAVTVNAGLRAPVLAAGLSALFGVMSPVELSEVELGMLIDALEGSSETVDAFCEACAQAYQPPVGAGAS